jgi:hypothetical protein
VFHHKKYAHKVICHQRIDRKFCISDSDGLTVYSDNKCAADISGAGQHVGRTPAHVKLDFGPQLIAGNQSLRPVEYQLRRAAHRGDAGSAANVLQIAIKVNAAARGSSN